MVGLGFVPLPGHDDSRALEVSADGSVVVGESHDTGVGGAVEAFRWAADTGMVGLGHLPGHTRSTAMAISGDARVVVGTSSSADWSDQRAFVWTAEEGMRDLREVLVELGVNMDGWALWSAWDVSDDGLVIVGRGDRPGGIPQESWRAVIPEPATLALLAVGELALIRRRRNP